MNRFMLSLFALAISHQLYAQPAKLIFATYTYSTNDRIRNLEPLVRYLSEKSGLIIEAKSYATVSALIEAVRNDSVDFAMMNTSGYLVLQRNHPGVATPLVNLDMGNGDNTRYGGCLIASRQSGIQFLDDLLVTDKELSLALVSSSSTSGNLMPRLMLNNRGITSAENKFRVYYAGTHRKVVSDVLSGKAMIGGCGCAEVDSARKNSGFDESAFVLSAFNNIPLGPVVYKERLDATIVNPVRNLLLRLHFERPDLFENFCNGWTEFKQAKQFRQVTDSDYQDFRLLFGRNEELWKLIQ